MKKFLALVLALVMSLSLVACGSEETTDEGAADGDTAASELNVGVFYYNYSDAYITTVRNAMDALLEEAGITYNNYDGAGNQATQLDQINTAISNGTNLLVVNIVETSSPDAAQQACDAAKNAGIPIIFFNREVENSVVDSYENAAFVGTDAAEAGHMQGQMIGEFLLENYDTVDLNGDGVISYVMFKGDEANQEAIARTKYGVECADEVLTAAGKPALEFYDASNANKYLVDLNGTWSNTASFDYMQTILAQYNEANNNMVEVVICNNDDMALGAINALVNAGYNLPGGEGCTVIPVFGVDATDAAKELIANKQMTGSIKQDAEGMADAVATITANLIAGKDKFEGLNESYEVVDGWTVNIPYSVYTGE